MATRRPRARERDATNDLYLYHRDGGAGLKLTGHEPAPTPSTAAPARPRHFVGAAFGKDARWILRSATIVGADAIGLGRELGSLEAGKLADLQVLDQNPLENIRHTASIRSVMVNGRIWDVKALAAAGEPAAGR